MKNAGGTAMKSEHQTRSAKEKKTFIKPTALIVICDSCDVVLLSETKSGIMPSFEW